MPSKNIDFWPVRYRAAAGDDPDYDALGLPPNTGIFTVGSGEAGDFVFRLTDLRGNTLVEVTTAFDTDEATTAENSADDINAAIAAAPKGILAQHVYEAIYPGAGDDYYVHFKQMPEFLVEFDTPGAATVDIAPGERWPIAASLHAGERAGGYPPATEWEFKVRAVDANGDFLPNAGTYTAQVLEGHSYVIPPSKELKWCNNTRGVVAGSVGDVHRVAVNGAHEITVLLTSLAAIDGSAVMLVIDAHPVLA